MKSCRESASAVRVLWATATTCLPAAADLKGGDTIFEVSGRRAVPIIQADHLDHLVRQERIVAIDCLGLKEVSSRCNLRRREIIGESE